MHVSISEKSRLWGAGLALALTAMGTGDRARAQSATVPAPYDRADAPSWGEVAGLTSVRRQQVLVDANLVRGLAGRRLTGVWFRRDSKTRGALPRGEADLVVVVSDGALSPAGATESFAANHGRNAVEVFRGRVSLPASPALPPGRTAGWGPAETVRITFTKPFVFSGGALCLDLRGAPVAGREADFWPIDFDYDTSSGRVAVVGASCYGPGARAATSSVAHAGTLRVGGTARLGALGRPRTTSLLLLGTRRIGQGGLDLTPFGAPGCRILVDADLVLDTFVHPWPRSPHGFAAATFFVPNQPAFAGARLLAQWANLEATLPRSQWTNQAGLTTSEALDLTLAPTPPRLGVATVTSTPAASILRLPARGAVAPHHAPVLRLTIR